MIACERYVILCWALSKEPSSIAMLVRFGGLMIVAVGL